MELPLDLEREWLRRSVRLFAGSIAAVLVGTVAIYLLPEPATLWGLTLRGVGFVALYFGAVMAWLTGTIAAALAVHLKFRG